jgi:hypothetical protein
MGQGELATTGQMSMDAMTLLMGWDGVGSTHACLTLVSKDRLGMIVSD